VFLQACKLKLGDVKGALMDTEFAMREGNNNAKALFRQGQVGIEDFELVFNVFCFFFLISMLLRFNQAYMVLNDIDAAVESFKKALTLEPNDG
jgi:peptidyl-prolyl isomerase D